MKILISACLLGVNCKYDGGNNRREELISLLRGHDLRSACPEMLGGLPSPRVPAEIKDGEVIRPDGKSADAAFRAGAEAALCLARSFGPELVILKSKSPSCGSGMIYDGSFSHRLAPGDGIFAEMLKKEGFRVMTEDEAVSLLRKLRKEE